MKTILVIGAGRSSSSLIDYLIDNSSLYNWQVIVTDMNYELALSKTKNRTNTSALAFDVSNAQEREQLISKSDIVISMLPAFMHGDVARDCVRLGKHMATASYVSDDMMTLDADAKQKGLILLNEIGLDPGIDHASAMKVIHHIQSQGGFVTSFKSYCGGLVAPESNDNPWGYKFSWNPRNVVLAGQSTAQYLDNNQLKFIPYNRLFTQVETIHVEGHGNFDAYANRDSISYKAIYGLEGIKTMLRGTLRMPGYCKAWNVFVKLGLTDDTYKIKATNALNYTELLDAYLPLGKGTVKERLVEFMGQDIDASIIEKLEYLDMFTNKPIRLTEATPAQLLQDLLEEKWKLQPHDKDMIVMQHQFEYELRGKQHKLHSSLVVKGDDDVHTAMAKTVGLPLAITVKNFLTGVFNLTGVQLPIASSIYEPLLKELETYDVQFIEREL